MPELPEVETIVRQMEPVLLGKKIIEIKIYWHRSIQGNVEDYERSLVGQIITGVWRRGKYFCFSLRNGKCATIHMGMSGKLIFNENQCPNKHLRIEFVLSQDYLLDFIDMRKFGKSRIWKNKEELLPRLGPEPLDSQIVYHSLQLLKTNRPIKSVLLDQSVIAGIGNIYADESLFRAGIHPLSASSQIDPIKLKRLSQEIPRVLDSAIQNMGTTISQYRPPNQLQGQNQHYLKVYGFTGKACRRCGNLITRIRINGRSSHFCPKCQPEPEEMLIGK
jgi:formamidopyrimidine-DNA glycosylase